MTPVCYVCGTKICVDKNGLAMSHTNEVSRGIKAEVCKGSKARPRMAIEQG